MVFFPAVFSKKNKKTNIYNILCISILRSHCVALCPCFTIDGTWSGMHDHIYNQLMKMETFAHLWNRRLIVGVNTFRVC